MPTRQPTFYVPHGGGPWPWMDATAFANFGGSLEPLRAFLKSLPSRLPAAPMAIVCISAHWETPITTVSTAAAPAMLHDYSGFPDHTYQVRYPANGNPELARKICALLEAAGIPSQEDAVRGFDHGTFVPLSVAWPKAEVPVVQLSLQRSLDPGAHLAVGLALAALRDEGVVILGSGMSYHNMRGFGSHGAKAHARAFDSWLAGAVTEPEGRTEALTAWASAPSARECHPREEHLLPLMVAAGAGDKDPGAIVFSDDVLGVRVSAVRFG